MHAAGRLFTRQGDIEADRARTGLECAAVGRFHDAGSATGDDDKVAAPLLLEAGRDEVRKAPSLLVEVRMGQLAFGSGKIVCQQRIRRFGCHARVELGKSCLRLLLGNDMRATEDNNGGVDPLLAQFVFGLEQFKLHAQRTQVVLGQKFDVLLRQSVCRPGHDRLAQRLALDRINHLRHL